MPADGETRARHFYGMLIGLPEIVHPANPASHRGVWFRSGSLHLHLGNEPDWPSKAGEPILRLPDLRRAVDALLESHYRVHLDAASSAAFERAVTVDPFGNHVVLVQANASGVADDN